MVPLTPAKFIQDIKEVGVPECDFIESHDYNQKRRYRQKIREDLRRRFRNEYLGQLIQTARNKNKICRKLKVGEIVLIGNDNTKRLFWPLAKVVELIPGRDGKVRLVRLKTTNGELLRPVQRTYPLEINFSLHEDDVPEILHKKLKCGEIKENKCTRSDRKIIRPTRYF